MIKYLIFDIGGVIIHIPRMDWDAQDSRFDLKKGTVKKIVDECFKKRSLDPKFDEKTYFMKNYGQNLSWGSYQQLLTDFYATEKPNYDLIAWITSQKPERKVFALTNNTIALNKLLQEKFKINDLFDEIFNSVEIGLAKPDPKLFQYMLKKIRATAKECLFVDDNLKNTEVADILNFKTITFIDNIDFKKNIVQLGL